MAHKMMAIHFTASFTSCFLQHRAAPELSLVCELRDFSPVDVDPFPDTIDHVWFVVQPQPLQLVTRRIVAHDHRTDDLAVLVLNPRCVEPAALVEHVLCYTQVGFSRRLSPSRRIDITAIKSDYDKARLRVSRSAALQRDGPHLRSGNVRLEW